MKLIAVSTSCVALGVGASTLINASAAPSTKAAGTAALKTHAAKGHGKGHAGLFRRAVHATLTVATKDGFKEVTIDRGTLTAVNGDTLTINESTKKLAGKTVTIVVPTGAKVRVNRAAAALGDLKAGQRVVVAHLPKQTVVRAHDKRQ
jgi:hypothetical protein